MIVDESDQILKYKSIVKEYDSDDEKDNGCNIETELTQELVPVKSLSSKTGLNSDHVIHQMAIVNARLAFDEQEFRERCQNVQTNLCQEFKEIVDSIYDALDSKVADLSKHLAQEQSAFLKDFESKLSSIRQSSVQATVIEQSTLTFISNIKQAYMNAFHTPTQ